MVYLTFLREQIYKSTCLLLFRPLLKLKLNVIVHTEFDSEELPDPPAAAAAALLLSFCHGSDTNQEVTLRF